MRSSRFPLFDIILTLHLIYVQYLSVKKKIHKSVLYVAFWRRSVSVYC